MRGSYVVGGRRLEGGDHRTQAFRRHVREHRLHPDENAASAFAAHGTRRLTAYLLDGHGDSSLCLPASLPAEFREPLPVGCCDNRHKTASRESRWQKRRRSDAPTVKDEIAIRGPHIFRRYGVLGSGGRESVSELEGE